MVMFLQEFYTPPNFWSRHKKNGSCWEWQGTILRSKNSSYGYGSIYYKPLRKAIYVHRLAWMLANNQNIPKGLVIMHRCDNGICYNPNHLLIGTPKENTLDMIKKGRGKFTGPKPKTHCKNGHKYTPENTRIVRYKTGRVQRKCLQCTKDENRRYNLKHKRVML